METPLVIRWSRSLPAGAQPSTVTISRDTAGRYFVSLLVEEEIAPLPPMATQVGLDLGLYDTVVLDTGEKVGDPKFFTQEENRLAKAQRRLAKKQLGSKNRAKAKQNVARIHARIADRRRDFLHKLSTRIMRENQTICVESLRVKAMVKHPTLAKAIHDVDWGSCCVNSPTKHGGMAARWWRLTCGIRAVSGARRVGMCSAPCHSRPGSGSAQPVALPMIGMSTPRRTSRPLG